MSGQYKLKRCPSCNKEHRKRGLFCGQSCANTNRVTTEETKSKLRLANREYQLTPEAMVSRQRNSHDMLTVEDFAVDIPDLPPDLSDWSEYDKTSDW